MTKRDDLIAVVGIGCRFPGAAGVAELWRSLLNRRDHIREVPADRFDIDAYYDPRPDQTGTIISREGGFLEDIRRFDASLFGISGREAAGMDPQQRLLLEVVWEAFEDGGLPVSRVEGTRTGVFVGVMGNEYRERSHESGALIDVYSESGGARSSASGRVSHTFGLTGPAISIDTACSSSLCAVHYACESLRSGAADMAVAGGTNVILEPESSIAFSQTGMLAADGRCKFGDASADGFVRSEGVGAVVLKPLERAKEDGDRIRAVIRATHVNNDGRSGRGFFLTPSREGQQQLLETIYGAGGEAPELVDFVEAHGTGTGAGDPVEIGALASVLGRADGRRHPLWVGSIKTNIGHTEGAAGMAGLIKSVLALEHRVLPPSLHFETPNPDIPWSEIDVEIPTEPVALERSRPLRAGVSSFGITGTNAHVALEEWTDDAQETGRPERSVELLGLSAHTPEALVDYAESLGEMLRTSLPAEEELYDVAYTLARRRDHRQHRFAVAGRSSGELAGKLKAWAEESGRSGSVDTVRLAQGKVAFVFSGQGGQWSKMGRALWQAGGEFRRHLEEADAAVERIAGWSPVACLENDHASWLDDVGKIQPAIFVVQVALAKAWSDAGVEPDAVVGHSLGEVAAAHLAGVLTLDEAAAVICARSDLLRRIAGEGAMAVVGVDRQRAEHLVESVTGRVSVAVSNSPASTVVSGEPKAVETVVEQLSREGVFCREIDVDVASHSPQVEPLLAPLAERLASLEPESGEIPIYSTVEGARRPGGAFGADYWERNLRESVRFADAAKAMLADKFDVFIEISPHSVLTHPLRQMTRQREEGAVVPPAMRRDANVRTVLFEGLGELYGRGLEIDWARLYPRGRVVQTPTYPFAGEEFWYDQRPRNPRRTKVRRREASREDDGRHPFLQRQFSLGTSDGMTVWEMTVSLERFPYLDDHRVRGNVVFPGAAYAEMALAAAREIFDSEDVAVESVHFDELLILPDDGERRLQLVAERVEPGRYEVSFCSYDPDVRDGATTKHVGAVLAGPDAPQSSLSAALINGANLGASAAVLNRQQFYEAIDTRGLANGPAFRPIESLQYHDGRVEGRLVIPESVAPELDRYVVHPAILDGVFQLIGPLILASDKAEEGDGLFLPSHLGQLRVHGSATDEMRAVASIVESAGPNDQITVDIRVYDRQGAAAIDVSGFQVKRVRRQPSEREDRIEEWFYRWRWRRDQEVSSRVPVSTVSDPDSGWVIFTDGGDAGLQLVDALERRGESLATVGRGDATDQEYCDHRLDADPLNAAAFLEVFDAIARQDFARFEGFVFLWDGREPEERDDGAWPSTAGAGSVNAAIALLQALQSSEFDGGPKLWFVTRGTQPVGGALRRADLPSAPIWGLARVVANELPEWAPRCVDLSSSPSVWEFEQLALELLVGGDELELAFREETRFRHRLERAGERAGQPVELRRVTEVIEPDDPYVIPRPAEGRLEELRPRRVERQEPGPDEIEVRIEAAGLNFADVVSSLGLVDETDSGTGQVGYGCAGRVVRAGSEVEDFDRDSRVVLFDPKGRCFGSYTTTSKHLACRIPESLSIEQAATLPAAFMTAYFGLIREANLQPGERILIHSASGGVGHAAVALARARGAEIYATAGTKTKRDYLREELGLERVTDSRSLDFVEAVEEWTDGEGVDVVLNTLTGEALRRGIELLRPLGRFVDLSKADMNEDDHLDLRPFGRSISYVGVDITRVSAHRPRLIGQMWERVMEMLESGDIEAIPIDSIFPVSDVQEAFRYMRRGDHIGKILVSMDVDTMRVERPVEREGLFESGATYLLTGGTGGLGLEVADWMSRLGAGHLVLVSRSGGGAFAAERIARIRGRGTTVTVARGDVGVADDLEAILEDIRGGERPLKGVFHLAAVLDDAMIRNQDADRVARVFGPKAVAAGHLDRLTRDDPLDYFVLFSSAAAMIGSPGQSNYASANEYLDALAHVRRSEGLPALSLDWGNWRDVGLAADDSMRGERLERRGFEGIEPEAGIEALERLLMRKTPARVGVFGIDWGGAADAFPLIRASEAFGHLVPSEDSEEAESGGELARSIRSADGGVEADDVAAFLRQEVSEVLGTAGSRIDFSQPVGRIGLDSLMVVELRVRLENSLGVELSSNAILGSRDLDHLTESIVRKLS